MRRGLLKIITLPEIEPQMSYQLTSTAHGNALVNLDTGSSKSRPEKPHMLVML